MAIRWALLAVIAACVACADKQADNTLKIVACSTDAATQQAQLFEAAKQKDKYWSACPQHIWLAKFAELQATTINKQVIFDIGCNKGYESAAVFDHLAKSVGFNPASLYQHLVRSKTKMEMLCGACNNCHERAHLLLRPESSAVEVHCFEPGQINFQVLQGCWEAFFGVGPQKSFRNRRVAERMTSASASQASLATLTSSTAHPKHSWILQNMAVGDKAGQVQFPRGCQTTRCSLDDAGEKVNVSMTTVDQYMADQGLQHIDLLKVDAEGHDPAALDGAKMALSSKAVGLLTFEHNDMGMWKARPLKAVISQLQDLGYVCYYDGAPNLTRITSCWHDSYNLRTWSNVVCAADGSQLVRMLEGLSFLSTHNLLAG